MDTTVKTPVGCETCRSLATHADCGTNCLSTQKDYEVYRTTGIMPACRFQHWVESNPVEQMQLLHDMQVSGERSIVIGWSGEAEVNAQQTPEECSKRLHNVAGQCGYYVGALQHADGGESSIVIDKEGGPFRVVWSGGKLSRILRQTWSQPDYPARAVLVREVAIWSRG